jgi:hypothetical protein
VLAARTPAILRPSGTHPRNRARRTARHMSAKKGHRNALHAFPLPAEQYGQFSSRYSVALVLATRAKKPMMRWQMMLKTGPALLSLLSCVMFTMDRKRARNVYSGFSR